MEKNRGISLNQRTSDRCFTGSQLCLMFRHVLNERVSFPSTLFALSSCFFLFFYDDKSVTKCSRIPNSQIIPMANCFRGVMAEKWFVFLIHSCHGCEEKWMGREARPQWTQCQPVCSNMCTARVGLHTQPVRRVFHTSSRWRTSVLLVHLTFLL